MPDHIKQLALILSIIWWLQKLRDTLPVSNILGENINTVRNIESLLDPSEEVGLGINTQHKNVVMSRHQNAG
jgi:hypothetical protein